MKFPKAFKDPLKNLLDDHLQYVDYDWGKT